MEKIKTMKSSDVKVGRQYILKMTGEVVTVLSRNKGRYISTEPYSGSKKHNRKSFTLSNGCRVYSDKLIAYEKD